MMELQTNYAVEENSFALSAWRERTMITDVVPLGSSSLEFSASIPATGSNRGYFVRIIDENDKEVPGTYQQHVSSSPNVEGRISSQDLSLFTEDYRLEFGPHYTATNVNAVGATVSLDQGQPSNFQGSSLTGLSDGRDFVVFRYATVKEIFDTQTDVQIYLVEGQGLQPQSAAVEGKVFTLKKGDPYTGVDNLKFGRNLAEGKTYTLCMGIFSGVRQIAGYSFIAR
jgi:hypothetical protein